MKCPLLTSINLLSYLRHHFIVNKDQVNQCKTNVNKQKNNMIGYYFE